MFYYFQEFKVSIFLKLTFSIFHILSKESPNSLWKMLFISLKVLCLFLRYSNFCNFPRSCPTSSGLEESEKITTLCNGLDKLPIIIFGITQKPLRNKALKMAKWWIAKERKLLSIRQPGNWLVTSFRAVFYNYFHKKDWVQKQKWNIFFWGFLIILSKYLVSKIFQNTLAIFLVIYWNWVVMWKISGALFCIFFFHDIFLIWYSSTLDQLT